ncbi:hypothetical protein T12_15534 [Trichinella patagoniensis]|uniref:Uncharacterized protein n=1 Tax=Trichinella patagoniensis TaxID=990121 RepID=A0A0V0ZCL8_9BILA|nr:hypothetical protein T12_15534 [Trichinella patagoniensis]
MSVRRCFRVRSVCIVPLCVRYTLAWYCVVITIHIHNRLTAIDKVFTHRRDVLACLRKASQRDPYSTLAVYEHNKK